MVFPRPSSSVDLRLPAEQRPGAGDVRLAHLRVVLGQRPVHDLALEPVISMIFRAICSMVISCGLPMFTGSWTSASAVDAVHQVADVAEAAGLRAVAEDRDVLVGSACDMNAGTTRPSLSRIRGP